MIRPVALYCIRLVLLLVPACLLAAPPGVAALAPDIELRPDSLVFEMAAGDTGWSSFTIANVGGSPLDFQLAVSHSSLFGGPDWIRIEPRQGQIAAGGSGEIRVRFDARELNPGWPVGAVVLVDSNDPDEPEIDYLVTLELLPFRPVEATLDIRENLSNRAGSPWITAFIELPAGFDPAAIMVSSVRLNAIPPDDSDRSWIKDRNHDDVPELSLRFDRDAVLADAGFGKSVELVVTGDLNSGRSFIGRATVQISGGSTGITAGKSMRNPIASTTWSGIKLRSDE